jgi:hypothetical protein
MLLSLCTVIGALAAPTIPTMTIGKDINGVDVKLPLSGIGTWQ